MRDLRKSTLEPNVTTGLLRERDLARLGGYGATCDAYHRVRPAPDMEESARAMRLAIQDAADGATGLDGALTLSWDAATDPDGDAVTYTLYLDGDADPATAVASGLSPAAVASALADLAQVPGRFEIVAGPTEASPSVVVDYAHTPDALENVLGAAGELLGPGGRLVVVFGCGGDRDREKRPLMGEVATRTADRVVVTSDNPRSEDPMGIIEQVLRGCDDSVVVEPDRRTAIRVALSGRGPADVVVIAGKGHETGQDFGDRVEPFDDRVVASEELRERGGGR